MSFQFIRFLFAGGLAAAANFGSRFLYSKYLDYELAIVAAYLTGMLIAFLLMRGHVFRAKKGRLLPQIFKFILVNLAAVGQTLAISLSLVKWGLPYIGIFVHTEAIAHLAGVLFPAITSFFGHKFLTFR